MKKLIKNYKMPKSIGWLIPGLEIKRWFLISFIGLIFLTLGAMVLFNMQPVILMFFDWIKTAAKTVPTDLTAGIFVVIGLILFVKGWQNSNYSMFDIKDARDKNAVLESLYRRRKML